MKYVISICLAILLAGGSFAAERSGEAKMNITIENDHARIVIGQDGTSLSVIDKASKKDYCANKPAQPIAKIIKDGKTYPAISAAMLDGKLSLGFGDSGVNAIIGVAKQKRFLTFEVIYVSDDKIDAFVFADIYLSEGPKKDKDLTACAISLNLKTNVSAIPSAATHLEAICYPKFGMKGAKVALIFCPKSQLRTAMKDAILSSPDLPHSSVGGPWAYDSPANRESYMLIGDGITLETADSWIKMVKDIGITQIDFHGGGSFRFGDCLPNPSIYPNGRADFKAVIDKLHAAGIKAGLHTYAHFVDRATPWVTPVPNPGIGKDATFTLTSAIGEKDDVVPVNEDTKNMSTVMGFATRNSITLQIDDELIEYNGISKEQPYKFTSCKRGACGTEAVVHAAGAKVYHIKECFGLFSPDGDSQLLIDVAAATADFYNECGFDMIYLDALDGEDTLGGSENSWHYGSKFVFEIMKRAKKAPIMEMSTFHHHLWMVRARMGAWDHPVRSYKKFIDVHVVGNKWCDDMFLPAHLGWWKFVSGLSTDKEINFMDDVEYLLAKCAATQCGLSPQGFNPKSMAKSSNLQRIGGIMKKWENLRLAGFFTEPMRKRLVEPGVDFTLTQDKRGNPQVREVQYSPHKVETLDPWSSTWQVDNQQKEQPVRLRIQALQSAQPYDSPDGLVVADFKDIKMFNARENAPGVSSEIVSSKEQVKFGDVSGLFSATRKASETPSAPRKEEHSIYEHGKIKIHGGAPSWAKNAMMFSPTKDFGNRMGLGLWVYGDGKGEILNLQLRSPIHLMTGIYDHYVIVDFTGWRYFALVEPEGDRIFDFGWPYAMSLYEAYRQDVVYNQIESLGFWYNNVPEGQTVKCYLSPVKALPVVKTKLVNPSVTIGGKTISFPGELDSGAYLEYNSATDCKLYDANGDFVRDIKPLGDAPVAKHAVNDVTFNCTPPKDGLATRANVWVITDGNVLKK